jgi:hypothetical protein
MRETRCQELGRVADAWWRAQLAAVLGLPMTTAPILFIVAAVFTPGTSGSFLTIGLIWVGLPRWIMRLL